MRRLFIASGIFHPESGGPATYLYEILPELQQRGWDVRLLTYGSGTTETYPYPVKRIARESLPRRVFHYAQSARPLLRWADLTYVHTLGLPLVGGKSPRILKIVGDQAWERAIRKRWISPIEDIDEFQTKRYSPVVTLQKAIRAWEARRMDAVIVPSAYLKRMVAGWGVDPARIHIIYNALPPGHAAPVASKNEARAQLGLGEDEHILFTAARLNPWKGVGYLIGVLPSDVRLIVAGDGESRASLEEQVRRLRLSERVTFLGSIPREQVALHMKAADYFALYSGYEGLSHSLLESLRAGTPVIASDKGGNPEVVSHGVNGLLVPYRDVNALRETLHQAFQPGFRDSLAANSAHGMERFNFAGMVEQTSGILERYLRTKS